MKFSPANAKIKALATVAALQPFLTGNRKVYSFDLLSGHNCPYARDCHSKAVEKPGGGRMIVDGKHTDFRCFSASQEVFYNPLYNLRKNNGKILEIAAMWGSLGVASALQDILPKNAGIIRIHVGGDFATKAYFQGWLELARRNPSILFYAYTKSTPFWVSVKNIPDNFVLTASKGGMRDDLIGKHGLRQAVVVHSEAEAASLGLEIDHDDSHAANPATKHKSFALLIHGIQPKGSEWGTAVKALKGNGSYSR